MASDREIAEDIDGTFDVDVVGLTDLEFKSDGELFYFGSNEEYGLFGEDGGSSFSQSASYTSNGEKETSINTLSPGSQKSLKCSPLKKKSKTWNEMEKDLFLKGLELFGKHWRKISKFIATKTSSQVKQYYQQWAETAHVIPDAVNVTNDTSVYLPFSTENVVYIRENNKVGADLVNLEESKVLIDHNANNNCMSLMYTGATTPIGMVDIPIGEGMVVSSLHDWNLGSQVSVSGTEEEEKLVPFEYRSCTSPIKKIKTTKKERLNKNKVEVSKFKKLTPTQNKKAKRQDVNQAVKVNDNAFNIIPESRPRQITEGQIIRLDKNEDEDSEVNIDDSDANNDEEETNLVVCDEMAPNRINSCDEDTDEDEEIFVSNKNSMLQHLNMKEQEFYLNIASQNDVTLSQCIAVRDRIIEHWEKLKPVTVCPNQINIHHYKPSLINSVFKYLEKSKIINNLITSSSHTYLFKKDCGTKEAKKCTKPRRVKDILSNEKLRSNVIKQGGGITLSHDSSGAVIGALHIPEAQTHKRKKTLNLNPHNVQLRNYLEYDSNFPAPYEVVLYPQALIPLDFHSHSSLAEVIGLLGGFLNDTDGVLHITLAVPTKSASSKVECEMCPVSQTEAMQIIHNNSMNVVGWYHSHPTFHPNPSQMDLTTQEDLQKLFRKKGMPFMGLIISSYNTLFDSRSSQIRCFTLNSQPNEDPSFKSPYQLDWKLKNEFDIEWDGIELSIKNVLSKRNKRNSIRWKDQWTDAVTYLDKYISSLCLILPRSNQEVIDLVKDFLIEIL